MSKKVRGEAYITQYTPSYQGTELIDNERIEGIKEPPEIYLEFTGEAPNESALFQMCLSGMPVKVTLELEYPGEEEKQVPSLLERLRRVIMGGLNV